MIFVQGYVHCDPHPGNVLVNKTKRGTQIVLLDHGLYQVYEKNILFCDNFKVIGNTFRDSNTEKGGRYEKGKLRCYMPQFGLSIYKKFKHSSSLKERSCYPIHRFFPFRMDPFGSPFISRKANRKPHFPFVKYAEKQWYTKKP